MKFDILILILVFLAILGLGCSERHSELEEEFIYQNPCDNCECEYEDCEGFLQDKDMEIKKLEEKISDLEEELENLRSN